MRTVIIILIGLALATAVLRLVPSAWRTAAALMFTLLWLAVSLWNLRTGLSHGYTLAQEVPIHVPLFGVPVALAWALWWYTRRG